MRIKESFLGEMTPELSSEGEDVAKEQKEKSVQGGRNR